MAVSVIQKQVHVFSFNSFHVQHTIIFFIKLIEMTAPLMFLRGLL
jgi:hypothetical protein